LWEKRRAIRETSPALMGPVPRQHLKAQGQIAQYRSGFAVGKFLVALFLVVRVRHRRPCPMPHLSSPSG
jgi:hypothetical protein